MKNSNTPTIDERYRRYADLLLRHHRLLSEGDDESAETEAVEDEMTRLWDRLDATQQRSLSGLGSDLNWVRRRCGPAPRGRRPDEVTPEELQALAAAHQTGDWHELLHLLRYCAPMMPTVQLAGLRAAAWAGLRFPHLASLFGEVAVEPKLAPRNG